MGASRTSAVVDRLPDGRWPGIQGQPDHGLHTALIIPTFAFLQRARERARTRLLPSLNLLRPRSLLRVFPLPLPLPSLHRTLSPLYCPWLPFAAALSAGFVCDVQCGAVGAMHALVTVHGPSWLGALGVQRPVAWVAVSVSVCTVCAVGHPGCGQSLCVLALFELLDD